MRAGFRGALVVLAAIAAASCATKHDVQHSEHMLSDAGFHPVAADSQERVDALHRLAPDTVTEVRRGDRMFYVYPDPKLCGCLYVGSEDEYDEYRRLVQQAGSPQPKSLPWNEGELSNGAVSWELWGAWPWWD